MIENKSNLKGCDNMDLRKLLEEVKNENIDIDFALEKLKDLPMKTLDMQI